MGERFECLHSGNCCECEFTQINITIGDIVRLAGFLKIPAGELVSKGFVRIVPFFTSDTVFEAELGLWIPCKLRQDKRCAAYLARPLSCRLFPYWVFAEIPRERLKEFVDESYTCVHSVRLSPATRERYRRYTKDIVSIMNAEGDFTDGLMNKLFAECGLDKRLDAAREQDYAALVRKIGALKREYSGIGLEKAAETEKIRFGIAVLERRGYGRIAKNLIQEIKKLSPQGFASIEQLEILESERDKSQAAGHKTIGR